MYIYICIDKARLRSGMVHPLSPTTTVDAFFHGFIARFVGRWFGEVYRHGQGGFEGA